MFSRLKKIKKFVQTLAEIPERLAAIEERVKQLESSTVTITTPPTFIPYYPPYDGAYKGLGCIDGYGCDYPNPWFATIPPSCKKCGKQAYPGYTVTWTCDGNSQIIS